MSPRKSNSDVHVILVNSKDEQVGTMGKLEAHQNGGTLHRAFSVFIFNSRGEMLLQRRALSKYHSGGLLSNTCCSHPMPGEITLAAANRRLKEEMGMECELSEKFSFEYKAELDHDLVEWEYDHVLVGVTDVLPKINPSEVDEFVYMSLDKIEEGIIKSPEGYTEWFKTCLKRVKIEFSRLF